MRRSYVFLARLHMPAPRKDQASILLKLLEFDLTLREARKWWDSEFASGLGLDEFESRYPKGSEGYMHYRTIAQFWETVGVLVRHGLLDAEILFNTFLISADWEKAQKIVKDTQAVTKNPMMSENFEWLAIKKKAFVEKRLKKN
jgi:hypothetical protein